MNDAGRTIEVFAELGCPFTHLGLLRFVERRQTEGHSGVHLHVRAWPLEVVNGRALDPAFIAEEIAEVCEQMETDAFDGFDPAHFPATSLPAMTLEALAYDAGPAVGEQVSLELRDLVFRRSGDVTDPATLAAVADRHGIEVTPGALDDHRRLHADHAEGERRGVIGSPHFFTPAGGFFCPSLEVGRDDQGHLHVHADPEGFDRFVDSCLT
ncbi:MAG: DsbA family protein [Acidimicrobiia bacterium]|nr:DsbA family protein [Acidimicrobiia bacterium]